METLPPGGVARTALSSRLPSITARSSALPVRSIWRSALSSTSTPFASALGVNPDKTSVARELRSTAAKTLQALFGLDAGKHEQLFDQMIQPLQSRQHLREGSVTVGIRVGLHGRMHLGNRARQRGAQLMGRVSSKATVAIEGFLQPCEQIVDRLH